MLAQQFTAAGMAPAAGATWTGVPMVRCTPPSPPCRLQASYPAYNRPASTLPSPSQLHIARVRLSQHTPADGRKPTPVHVPPCRPPPTQF